MTLKFNPYLSNSSPMFTTADAALLSRDEVQRLMGWCDRQRESLWDGMTLQDILNVWHISCQWDNFESWSEDEGDVARLCWNAVVKDKQQHLELHESPDQKTKLAALTVEYEAWCFRRGIDIIDARELFISLTRVCREFPGNAAMASNCEWICDYVKRWDAAEG